MPYNLLSYFNTKTPDIAFYFSEWPKNLGLIQVLNPIMIPGIKVHNMNH